MTVKSIRRLAVSGTLAFGVLTGGGLAAKAQDEALVSFSVMKPEIAVKLAQAAMESCRGKGAQVAVAVVDRFGNLQMMLRDRFAGAHTPETARRKAWTAVSFRNDTLALSEVAKPGAEAYGANFITEALMLGGGVPVEAAGSIVGGVGVSGAPGGDMDDACARAGIEAVAADLAF
ncbi:heme-binding protein [Pelagibius sp. CAU 1746]|uniref:GlcG/HbpS family heme-binding protein n=1 Tax=Pelagibius sp. CAU 1746 TaxID=3140370 RepID=UPI00325AE0FA